MVLMVLMLLLFLEFYAYRTIITIIVVRCYFWELFFEFWGLFQEVHVCLGEGNGKSTSW